MKARRRRSARPLLTLLLAAGMLALALGSGGPARSALAQGTVPGGAPPSASTPPGAPPLPAQPTTVTDAAPLVAPVDPLTGISVAVETQVQAPTEASFSLAPATVQNVTDRNGNPVQPSTLEVRPAPAPATAGTPQLPAGVVNLSDVIQIRLLDRNGAPIDRPNFDPPAVLCFTPTADQVSAAGGIGNIAVQSFDSLDSQWKPIPSSVIGGQVCASVTHLSLFALTIVKAPTVPAALPNTGGPLELRLDLLLTLAALMALAGTAIAARRGGRARP